MSDITTNLIPESMLTAIGQIDAAVTAILEAQRLVGVAQIGLPVGGHMWHKLETIDDKLHDALAALGQ